MTAALTKDEQSPEIGSAFTRARAFSVHVLTAAGAALGLIALIAASRGDWPAMFAWLGLALLVDGIDGTIARRLRVAERLPRWSGDMLDFVVDFLTYVVVPAYALAVSQVLPGEAALPLALAVVMTGALYLADRRMKTADHYFRGFPALWNIAALYLFLLRPDPWLAAAAVVALAVLTFVPFPFIHPLRVERRRALNVALLAVWLMLAALAIWQELRPQPFVVAALCLIGLWFCGVGFLRRR